MCGIAALQIRNPSMKGQLGELMHGMLCEIVERGPDSAGLALYNDSTLNPSGTSTVTIVDAEIEESALADALRAALPDAGVTVSRLGETTLINASVPSIQLEDALEQVLPGAHIAGRGSHVTVLKGTGHPLDLAELYGLKATSGSQGLSHTRMATESAVTAGGAHPFTVADDLCLVHNGSFSNHATIRRQLKAEGVQFDSENDSEVAARFLARRMEQGDTLQAALEHLGQVFDGFFTLVVTTPTTMAIVRDKIACKPAIIAQTDDWVAMASEYRALASLPGIESATIFEPAPGIVYTWDLETAAAEAVLS